MNTWFNILGAWMPARVMIDIPAYYPLDDTPVYVTLPQSWMPHITGMCMTLLRPETWNAADPEAEEWANAAHDLMTMLNQYSTTPPGCENPEGQWFCQYDFTAGEQGFEIELMNGIPCGEYVSGVGFRAVVGDFGTGSSRYQRRLKLHKEFDTARVIFSTTLYCNYLVEFAPGGPDWRLQRLQAQDTAQNIINEHYARPANDDLNMEYGWTWPGLVPANRLWGDFRAGAAGTPGELDGTSFVLTEIDVYGYGAQPSC